MAKNNDLNNEISHEIITSLNNVIKSDQTNTEMAQQLDQIRWHLLTGKARDNSRILTVADKLGVISWAGTDLDSTVIMKNKIRNLVETVRDWSWPHYKIKNIQKNRLADVLFNRHSRSEPKWRR